MTYADSMARFGSDKPDLRMGLELVDCTDYFKDTPFRVFQAPYVGAVVMPGGASQPRKQLDAWQEWAKQRGARGLAYVLVQEDGELGGPVAKNLSEEERAGLRRPRGRRARGLRLLRRRRGQEQPSPARCRPARDRPPRAVSSTSPRGASSGSSTRRSSSRPTTPPPPVTSRSGPARGPRSTTRSPHRRTSSPSTASRATALAWAYDIVCNGNEIGGGSIRIHSTDVQKRVFAVMGLGDDEAQEKFGFLLDAFRFGAPPHGGIAFGWDRVTALLAGTESIREVIAFPKSGGGVDPLTDAPAPITPAQRKEAGVDARPRRMSRRTPDLRQGFSSRGRPRDQIVTAGRPPLRSVSHTVAHGCPARDRAPPNFKHRPTQTAHLEVDMGIPATESVATMPLEEEAPRPRGKKDKDFHGRSPTQIALGRLRRDPVAVVCGVVVLLLVLAGIFAPIINDALQIAGTSEGPYALDNVTATDFDGLPIVGPPLGEFTWDHPLGIAPGTAYDNLARLLLGLRTSLLIAHGGHGRQHDRRRRGRPDRRLLPRLARPGHLVHHRRVPVASRSSSAP